MATDLRDPDLSPGAVVEVREDGTAIRNDAVELQPASRNPWYVLATVCGEQTGEDVDWDLHAQNRRIWNGWACSEMDGAARAKLATTLDLPVEDLAPLTEAERATVDRAFQDRLGEGVALPSVVNQVDFRRTHFSYTVVWEKCVFSADANFRSATFSEFTIFEFAAFGRRADFHLATFGEISNFTSATFSGSAYFPSAIFSGSANFHSATFSEFTIFEFATFGRRADFHLATFGEISIFSSAIFSGSAYFPSAIFSGYANFHSATFNEYTTFNSAIFGGGASFDSATFSEFAYFPSAIFSGYANFHSATFSGETDFASATFREDALFINAEFHGTTDFESATFGRRVPKFQQAQMHQDTVFSTRPNKWPKIPIREERKPDSKVQDDDKEKARQRVEELARVSKRNYARLRQIMTGLQRPDDAHFFLRQEMRCKAELEGSGYKLLIRAYGFLSEYGYSVWKPLLWLGVVWALGAVAFLVWAMQEPDFGPGAAMAVSLGNTLPFLGITKSYFAPDFLLELPAALKVLSGLQSVLAAPLLFLFGLGLHTRFRLR